MMAEIKYQYGVRIDEKPLIERGPATQAEEGGWGRLVLVEASHMARIHEHLPPDTISLAIPGFKASEQNTNRLLSQIKDLCLTEHDTVVLDLLSNTAFLGTNEHGLPTKSTRGDDGRYHITGSLTSAPTPFLKRALKAYYYYSNYLFSVYAYKFTVYVYIC
jgi:hypothetical protein